MIIKIWFNGMDLIGLALVAFLLLIWLTVMAVDTLCNKWKNRRRKP